MLSSCLSLSLCPRGIRDLVCCGARSDVFPSGATGRTEVCSSADCRCWDSWAVRSWTYSPSWPAHPLNKTVSQSVGSPTGVLCPAQQERGRALSPRGCPEAFGSHGPGRWKRRSE
ncbi:hypothetical protein chiPu_0022535 [Chiloscyllium punctatum]|uniref:Uncharacterized protein n=1 Tax=Chiloscyllium punctatum TaxID=137246 RepID=A0A401RK34_CHIPU|nr:hypothetical protein [Chiloscyllium punctatum]